MASVVFYMEDGTTLVHTLAGETTAIGRHPDCDVVLTCPSSSGRHAVLKQQGERWYVHDLDSSNGTRVNGAEIEEALLNDGDRVGFGDVQAVFYAGNPPAVLEDRSSAAARGGAPLPPPTVTRDAAPPGPPATRGNPPGRALSPVRRAHSKTASGYPDTSESSCLSGFVVVGLFVVAFIVGLALRHSQEMNGNLFSDILDKMTGGMPKIKIERKEE